MAIFNAKKIISLRVGYCYIIEKLPAKVVIEVTDLLKIMICMGWHDLKIKNVEFSLNTFKFICIILFICAFGCYMSIYNINYHKLKVTTMEDLPNLYHFSQSLREMDFFLPLWSFSNALSCTSEWFPFKTLRLCSKIHFCYFTFIFFILHYSLSLFEPTFPFSAQASDPNASEDIKATTIFFSKQTRIDFYWLSCGRNFLSLTKPLTIGNWSFLM